MTDASMPTAPLLSIAGVSKTYRRGSEILRAVDDVSFEIRRGATVALCGPSGSGKSTLVNLVLGWSVADQGEVRFGSELNIGWEGVAVVPQTLGLLRELTIRENIELPARATTRAVDAEPLLHQLGITEIADRRPRFTSLGEQQRAAVARAALCAPNLLIADEPTSHQDDRSSGMIIEVLTSIAKESGALLVATHDPLVIEACDTRLTMHKGQLVSS